jgi:3-phosphoshikimate 1-carboxyvinyltransferase
MLRGLGIRVDVVGTRVTLRESHALPPLDITVPGDPSSAAYFAALAALRDDREIVLPGVCLNETRIGFLAALERMGASVSVTDRVDQTGEPVGTIAVRARTLRAISVEPEQVPAMVDEIPLLACVAARAAGETVIRGAGELRVKESDRLAATAANLTALGVRAEERGDELRVHGSDAPLRGRVHAFSDHRIAMAFGILGALPGNRIQIDEPACVDISYPGFWADLDRAIA